MGGFLDAASAFPAALFGLALVVVVGYWLAVLLGGWGVPGVGATEGGDGADSGDAGHGVGIAGVFAAFGLGGVPVTVTLSLLIVIAWFMSLSGTALFDALWLRVLVLPVAVFLAWAGTRLLIAPLRHLTPREEGVDRADLVGRVCTIRTGHVSARFGQAEVAAEDGSTAVVQVRADGTDAARLMLGSTALVFDYDAEGEFFRVAPFESTPGAGPAPEADTGR
ncbi:OB-fold-containig protein [Streptomyces sp. JJ38]|uniref:OB-fold-containig protein n=1 Tax=Streptomyces sp. JJ38 TaxID=2738128 RepID=UPI001C58ACFB